MVNCHPKRRMFMRKLIYLFTFCFCLCFCTLLLHGQEGRFSFALVTDTHIGSNGADIDLRRTVDDINCIDSISFVIVSGDVTEFGSDKELRLAKVILDRLDKPWYIIPGNHDTKWSESGANSFRVIFGSEAFAFSHGGWLFIGTNSGPNMRMGPGQIPRENIVWLDSVLSVPANREMKIVSVNHYPLDEGLNNWYELTGRLKKLDTRLALCGHGHSDRVMSFEGIPALMGRSNLGASRAKGGYNIITILGDTLLTASVRQPAVAIDPEAAALQEGFTVPAGPTSRAVATVYAGTTLPAWASVPLEQHDLRADTTVWSRPDYSMNGKFGNVRETWRIQENADIGAGSTVAGRLAIITTTAGEVKALSLKNRQEKWVFNAGAKIYSTPVCDGKRVIAVSADGKVRALDLKTGKVLWNHDAQQPIVASPVISGKSVFITGSSGRCDALDARDGSLLWSNGGIDGFVETVPLIYRGMMIFGTWDNKLYALDIITGDTRWVWNTGYANRMLSPAACVPVAAGDRLFVVAPDRKMACLDVNTGKLLWHSDLGGATVRESMGLSEDGLLVLAKTMNGEVIGVSSSGDNPEIVWRSSFNIGYDIAPSVITGRDGIIFIPSDKGIVHAASRVDGRLLWSHRISSCLINNIVPLKDGGLLVNSMDGVVVRLDW